MGEEIKYEPEAIADWEKEEFDRVPGFMLELYQRKLTGISNLTPTTEILQLRADYKHRITKLKRVLNKQSHEQDDAT